MSTSSLFALEDDLRALMESEETVRDEQREQYARDVIAAHMAVAEKRDRVAAFLGHCEMTLAGIAAEQERLRKLAAHFQGAHDRVSAMVLSVILERGVDEKGKTAVLDGNLCRFSARRSPPAVEVFDDAAIPVDLQRVVPETRQPDKRAIADALKTNRDIPGARWRPVQYKLERR